MKKFVAILLAALLVCTAASALAYSKDEPITITFWHTRGSGANYDVLKACVDGFNSTVGAEKALLLKKFIRVAMLPLPVPYSWHVRPVSSLLCALAAAYV